MIRLLQKNESEDHGTFTRDDFFYYVNGKWAETAVIPDDKPSTGGFMDLIQDIENLMLDIVGKWQRGEELLEDSISLQNFCQITTKMVVQILMHGSSWCGFQRPLINEIKAHSPLKTIPAS